MRNAIIIILTLLSASPAFAQCGPAGCFGNSQRNFGIINRGGQTIPDLERSTTPELPGFPSASTPKTFEDEVARRAIDGVTLKVNEVVEQINAMDARVEAIAESVTGMASDMQDAGILKQEIQDLGVMTKGLEGRVGQAEGTAAAAAITAEGAVEAVEETEKSLWGKTKTWLYGIIGVVFGGGILTWLALLVGGFIFWRIIRKQGMAIAQLVDKVTDVIPGTWDDKLLDKRAYDLASRVTGQPIPTHAMQPNMSPWGVPVENAYGNIPAPPPVNQPQPVQVQPVAPQPQAVQPQAVQPQAVPQVAPPVQPPQG